MYFTSAVWRRKPHSDEIAKTAGVTRGALYWHFKNKEDLFEALFQTYYADPQQQLEQALYPDQAVDPLSLLFNSVLHHFEKLVSDHDLRKFNTILYFRCEQTQDNHSIVELTRQYHRRWINCYTTSSTSANANRFESKAQYRARLISACFHPHGLTAKWLINPQAFDLRNTHRRSSKSADN